MLLILYFYACAYVSRNCIPLSQKYYEKVLLSNSFSSKTMNKYSRLVNSEAVTSKSKSLILEEFNSLENITEHITFFTDRFPKSKEQQKMLQLLQDPSRQISHRFYTPGSDHVTFAVTCSTGSPGSVRSVFSLKSAEVRYYF